MHNFVISFSASVVQTVELKQEQLRAHTLRLIARRDLEDKAHSSREFTHSGLDSLKQVNGEQKD